MPHADGHSLSVPHTAALATGTKRVGFKFSFAKSPKASRTYEVQPVLNSERSAHVENVNEKSPLAHNSPTVEDNFGEESVRPKFFIAPRKRSTNQMHDENYFDTSEPPSPTNTSSGEAVEHGDHAVFTFSPKDLENEFRKMEATAEEKSIQNGNALGIGGPNVPKVTFVSSTPITAPPSICVPETNMDNASLAPTDSSTKTMDSKFANLDKRKVRKMHSAMKLNRVSANFVSCWVGLSCVYGTLTSV